MNQSRKHELQIDDVVFTVDSGCYAQGNFRNRFTIVTVNDSVAIASDGMVLRREILAGNAVLTVDSADNFSASELPRYYYESPREREQWISDWDSQCE